ncbi:MAG: DUF4124 domain-containing protein [Woeseiaceae bacterium]
MLKRIFITTVAVITASTVMAQAYRWTDANGVVHYSDRPQEGAEVVQLPESTVSTRPFVPQITNTSQDETTESTEISFAYDSIEVSAPAPEETLWNIGGVLNVTLNLQPALQAGHQVRVYFDGEASVVAGTSFQLQEVYRGAHNIQAEVLDENGQLMGRSQPSRFYVQQNAIGN